MVLRLTDSLVKLIELALRPKKLTDSTATRVNGFASAQIHHFVIDFDVEELQSITALYDVLKACGEVVVSVDNCDVIESIKRKEVGKR